MFRLIYETTHAEKIYVDLMLDKIMQLKLDEADLFESGGTVEWTQEDFYSEY